MLNLGPPIYAVLGALHVLILSVCSRRFDPFLALVSLALVYDNVIIACGGAINATDPSLLLAVSKPRFWMHTGFTPLLAYSASGSWVATLALIGLGLALDHMEVRTYYLVEYLGTVRYSVKPAAPPLPAVLTTLIVIYEGFVSRDWSMFLGSLCMFLLAAIPPSISGPLPGQFGEVLIMWGMWNSSLRCKPF
jgi:hypothetical protein